MDSWVAHLIFAVQLAIILGPLVLLLIVMLTVTPDLFCFARKGNSSGPLDTGVTTGTCPRSTPRGKAGND